MLSCGRSHTKDRCSPNRFIGDLGLRSFSDLDFLISPADFERAKQVLAELGYRPSADLTPAVERLGLRTGYERSFDSAVGKNLVELQWALLPRFYGVDLSVENLLARAGPTTVGGCEMPLPICGRFVAGAVLARRQASLDAADLARGYCGDFAISTRNQAIDYALVSSRARALGIARILGVSFWLS